MGCWKAIECAETAPWEEAQKQYAFVDALAALRLRATGAGDAARFDYWLKTFHYMRATARMCCVWSEYTRVIALVKAENGIDYTQ